MSESKELDQDLEASDFQLQLAQPCPFSEDQLLINENKVAGHAGFYSIKGEPNVCLKPFNPECVRGRRECLFYQLIEYFNRCNGPPLIGGLFSETNLDKPKLCYSQLSLLIPPNTRCACALDQNFFQLLSSFVPKFYHVKYLSDSNDRNDDELATLELNYYNLFETDQASCPCYGTSAEAKSSCSRDYEKRNFFCLEDLTSHCSRPCIIDIKIGQITYDPMAIKEKILEQSSKYMRSREFGFRILGMKLGEETKDKNFGKALETDEQVYSALEGFFVPLVKMEQKAIVIGRMLEHLDKLVTLFEEKNLNQLKFFSSSILMVYDAPNNDDSNDVERLADQVRVSMIDFAHVFHVHSHDGLTIGDNKDNNYLYGLRKLKQYFIKLNRHHQPSLQPPHLPPV